MPIPVINYAAIPAQGNPLFKGLLSALQQGLQLGATPSSIRDERKQRQLANALSQIKLDYAPRQMEADIQQSEALAKMPFFGKSLPGSAGEILALENLKQYYGENSPQYQQAVQAFKLQQQGDQSRINYQDALTQTMPVRNLTQFGKQITEIGNVRAGLPPTGQPITSPLPQGGIPSSPGGMPNNQLTPLKDAILKAYERKQLKDTTDADTRQKNLYATNIEKTISRINPSALTQYGGARGKGDKLTNKILSAFGAESKGYDEYMRNIQDVEFLSSQITQFYGTSIRPEMIERLDKLSNPATWSTNPKLAKALFNETKTVLENEMQTYRDALEDTEVYKGNNNALTKQQIEALAKGGIGKTEPMNSYITPERLEFTAKKYNMTIDEVKAKLGIQ